MMAITTRSSMSVKPRRIGDGGSTDGFWSFMAKIPMRERNKDEKVFEFFVIKNFPKIK
jgi:hypothetical protein